MSYFQLARKENEGHRQIKIAHILPKKRNAGRTMLEFVNTIWLKAMGAMGSVEFMSSSSDLLTREC